MRSTLGRNHQTIARNIKAKLVWKLNFQVIVIFIVIFYNLIVIFRKLFWPYNVSCIQYGLIEGF
jgi:hypothetical protein